MWEKVNPMEVAHIDAFRRDPDRFWSFYSHRFISLRDKRPNRAHEIVAEFEARGLIRVVVTQNIDRLHRAAGSVDVIEVHGSIEHSVCLECGGRFTLERVVAMIERYPTSAPECNACIAPLKPDVVLFGELLPEAALRRAHDLALEADLMLCIGSSLEVHPVAALPRITLENGGRVALVTQGPTPYDRDAELKLEGDVVDALEAVLASV
ncbi:MAG: Silent information regulator protein Sir2 [Acidobacteria bacterium]|nr:Silent information regulator protein Sir2 [Acidobacteriota bacterium]